MLLFPLFQQEATDLFCLICTDSNRNDFVGSCAHLLVNDE